MRSIHRSVWADLLLIAALIFGAFVRFNPSLSSDFVIKQGGMFAVMIDDLRANQYRIPEYTSYNHTTIPYAYPPVGFYAGAAVADLLGLRSDQVLRWLPAFFASLSVLAFYFLAIRLAKDRYRAAVATLLFALMPRAFSWFVTGSGLTRSPGQFFMLLTLAAVVRLYQEKRRRDLLWAGVFGGLVVMSHPEAALHTAVVAVFLWIMLSRSRAGFVHSLGIALIVLLVSAPWWGTVVSYHGMAPLLSAVQTGQKSAAVLNLLFFSFTEEPYSTLIAVLGLVGLAYSLFHKDYLLPLWLAVPFIAEGRSAAGPAAIPLALLAAIGLLNVILPSLLPIGQKVPQQLNDKVPAIEFSLLVYVLLYGIFSAYQFGLQLPGTSLPPSDREAMHWIGENTPEKARFLVLTGTGSVSCDSILEWFPALAGRHSLYTVQGAEWTQGRNFSAFVTSTYTVQRCLFADDVSCLDEAVDRSQYEYIYLTKRFNACSPPEFQRRFPLFLESIESDPGFAAVYETAEIIVLEDLTQD